MAGLLSIPKFKDGLGSDHIYIVTVLCHHGVKRVNPPRVLIQGDPGCLLKPCLGPGAWRLHKALGDIKSPNQDLGFAETSTLIVQVYAGILLQSCLEFRVPPGEESTGLQYSIARQCCTARYSECTCEHSTSVRRLSERYTHRTDMQCCK